MDRENSCADERKRRTVEYRNSVQSSTISYSKVVRGITNKYSKYFKLVVGLTFNSYSLRLALNRNWGLIWDMNKISFSFENKTSLFALRLTKPAKSNHVI